MPTKLTEPIEDRLRGFFEANIRPSEIHSYNPDQTWPTDNPPDDALVITTNWDDYGDFYPIIVVNQTDSPVLPGSGETNYNGLSGDGSGPTQTATYPVTVSCQAVEGQEYLGNKEPKEIAFSLYQECHHQIQNNTETVDSQYLFSGMTPPTLTKSNTEENGDSTDTWFQYSGTCDVGVINEP